ncbi:hypothetical protein SLS56_008807 [Neofusicoccum ribis]|uniref:EKC/KEOPS complex subunit BUD32 n=1 Tax=Neofusicoccum ribis TaxID=45134 RepID=A0ABR3SJL7_9PEZI
MDEARVEYSVRNAKGPAVAGGVSGIVELISPGSVAKSPWPGSEEALCRKDIQLEAEVYRILGPHQRLVKFFGYNPEDGSITLEYMRHGTVREYLKMHGRSIPMAQRLRWAIQAAEGLALLHSSHILHCDFSPRNLLLNSSLELKVADFGGCSINGSWSSAEGSVRFHLPRALGTPPTVRADVFALGSTVYEIMTDRIPYEDVASGQVERLYKLSQFPDLSGVQLGEIIRRCWLSNLQSAQEVYSALRSLDGTVALRHN